MKLSILYVFLTIITEICCHKYFIKQIPRPKVDPQVPASSESAIQRANILMSSVPFGIMRSSSVDNSGNGGSGGSSSSGSASSSTEVNSGAGDASKTNGGAGDDVKTEGDATSTDASTSSQNTVIKTDEDKTKKIDPKDLPITDELISKHLDEITIHLKGQDSETCIITHLFRNKDKAKFNEVMCTIGDKDEEVACKPKCNEKVKIKVNSGRSVHYFRLVEGSTIQILAVPADMPRLPETDITLSEEEALFSVNNLCSDNYRCRIKSTKNDKTLIKVKSNTCESHNIAIPIRYEINSAYYSYCGANQAKVMFYANKSFYNKDNKYKYVPFTVTQSTTTQANFPLEVHNPYMNNEICHFQIKVSEYKDKCLKTGESGDDKCYKYCQGITTLISTGQSGDASEFTIKIETRHGNQEYKVKKGKNTITVSDITETSVSYAVLNSEGSNKCFPSLVHAKLSGIPMSNICGESRNAACPEACATKTPLKLLTPNTAYILEMIIGTSKDDTNKYNVNKFFATNTIKFNETQAVFFGDSMVIKPETEKEYESYLPIMKCYVRYAVPRRPRKVLATCSDGKPCVGLCSQKFNVIKLPVNITISVELVHAGHIDHPVYQVSKLITKENTEAKADMKFDAYERTLSIVPDATKPGQLCNIVIFASNPTNKEDKFLFERKGIYTDEEVDCGSLNVFNNVDISYDYQLMSGDSPSSKPVKELEVGKQGSGTWMKKNWWIILAVVGALIVVIGGAAYMANKSND